MVICLFVLCSSLLNYNEQEMLHVVVLYILYIFHHRVTSRFLMQGTLKRCQNLTKLNLSRTNVADKGMHFYAPSSEDSGLRKYFYHSCQTFMLYKCYAWFYYTTVYEKSIFCLHLFLFWVYLEVSWHIMTCILSYDLLFQVLCIFGCQIYNFLI